MSSLAAAKADNFYHPPDFDPKKHGSLNKYNGQHALRERARKLDQGILIIRFEMPFHVWCDKCKEKIATGERFNAEKKAIGNYHSTKIWEFSMRHHCGSRIVITTDPKNAQYIVVEGARKKNESYTAADAEVIELAAEEEREKLRSDALYRLEHGEAAKQRARSAAEQIADLQDLKESTSRDDYQVNKLLRAQLREARKQDAALEERRKTLNLHESVRLLPASESDEAVAALAFYNHEMKSDNTNAAGKLRQGILGQSIFSSKATAGAAAGNRGSPAGLGPSSQAAAAQGGLLASGPGRPASAPPASRHSHTLHSGAGQHGAGQSRLSLASEVTPAAGLARSTGAKPGGLVTNGRAAALAAAAEALAAGKPGAVALAAAAAQRRPAPLLAGIKGMVPQSTGVASGGGQGMAQVSKGAGKRTLLDKAASLAKRQRADGVKLQLTQPFQ
mmetsp:Transcript_31132/g.69199  ORF Transcript_31132/g.69199 Transcript_31132/m.69199 type:complete len:447 (-) Transcript_31132:278-1618(-)|eukprot:CAMPEP_0202915268 /NCGR_PEP_ID=MMETSP1392-20130828/65218_1 /ASSEMBLY_ACC=CAM_ASM_000868 /TAXON_ID=225041 /ORGANISM="Chlamydomonas chlamydogama, Strain SAG 11-48b" /LENGTH=446 /DNA_ID=CAMNT_0049607211 /DNA_START=101 /DNA_END=1441 /DNA_ORIENTATION=+